jgi:hypothetical protein
MPVSFSSPPRNLFLLGSSGADVVRNFFHEIDKSSGTDDVYIPDEIRYDYNNDRYNLAGTAQDSNSKEFGWLERRNYDPDLTNTPSVPTSTEDWRVKIVNTNTATNIDTTLRAMESYGNDLVVVGKTGQIPWIAKYTNGGAIVWSSTSNTGNVEYTGVCSSGGRYYACGNTPDTGSSTTNNEARAFVEKFDANGNPSWGKSAFMLGRDVVLQKISANSRDEVIAVGYLEDDTADKGYIVKINANTGEILWDRTLERNISGSGGSSSNDDIAPADVRCTATYIDGNDFIYVVGSIDGKNPVDNGVGEFVVKYSPEGNILWQRENHTDHYTNLDGAPNMIPFDVKSDTDTQQTVVLSVEDQGSFALNNSDIFISKYSKDGTLVFRRKISKSSNNLGAASLDADPSFYYVLFRDQQVVPISGTPDRYFFGKVSTSGNGLGNFQYDDGGSTPVDYTIVSNAESKIGRLSDGSVRNDSSDFITYPFTANKLVFDDLATPVSNKKRQMDSAGSFEYSGSPSIRPADNAKKEFTTNSYPPQAQQNYIGLSEQLVPTAITGGAGTNVGQWTRQTTNTTITANAIANPLNVGSGAEYYNISATTGRRLEFSLDSGVLISGQRYTYSWWMKGIILEGVPSPEWQFQALHAGSNNSEVKIVDRDGNILEDLGARSNYIPKDTEWHRVAWTFTAASSTASAIGGYNSNTLTGDLWYLWGAQLVDGNSAGKYVRTFAGPENANGDQYIPSVTAGFNYEFDGTDELLQIGEIEGDFSSFTVEMWFNTDRLRNWDNPIDCNFDYASPSGAVNSGNIGPRYEINVSGSSAWIFGSLRTSNDPFLGASTGTITTNTWYHTIFTYDGNLNETTATAYLNGVQTGTANPNQGGTYGWVGEFKNLVLGKGFGLASGRFFDGEIGEVRLYNRALTAAAVFQNYNATKSKYTNQASTIGVKVGDAIRHNGLILHYDFNNKYTYDPSANLIFPSNIGQQMLNDSSRTTQSIDYSIKDPFGEYGGVLKCEHISTGGGYFRRGRNTPLTAGKTYTISFYFKNGTISGNWEGRNTINGPSFSCATFNPSFEAPMQTLDKNTPVGNGWYKQIFTFTPQYSQTYQAGFNISHNQTPLGIFYLAGFQLEEADEVGRFIPTKIFEVPRSNIVRNLSSDSFNGTADGCTFNSDGYFEFDGVNDEMNIAHSSNMAFTNSLMSIEAWVYIDTLVDGGKEFSIVNKRGNNSTQNNNRPYVFGVNGDARIRWILKDPSNTTMVCDTATGLIQTGQWYHLAATHDGTDAKIYVNGVLNKTQSSSISSLPDTGNIPTRIGYRYRNSDVNYSDGRIGELRMYDRALSLTEVSLNYLKTKDKYGL